MTAPDISIIIVSYNTREMTLECIRSVFCETKDINYELIVLDNASSDDTVDAIKSEFGDKINLIASEKNLGFAAGNNFAATLAKSDLLLLLNPDTVVLDHAIDKLYGFANRYNHAGIWGGKTLFDDRSLNPASCWSRQTIWSLFCQAIGLTSLFRNSSIFNPEGIGGWDREGIRSVNIVSGCFFLIKKELWLTLGGFRKDFFMYGEEADLCLRAKNIGANPMVTSKAVIIHYGGASEKVRADKMIRLLRAKSLLIKYHFPRILQWTGLRLLILWPISRYFAHSVLSLIGKSSSVEPKRVWGEIVSRKDEWKTFN